MRGGILILSGLVLACLLRAEKVRVWQGTITLPTYEEGAPDPNPPFDQYATTRFSYPYTLRENLTAERRPHAWRALFLENRYLKCSVLPDLGGHVYTCVDKLSGQPMFYANPSIKKANIGYRGAWAAFGIEFNFPVSHNWVSMSPVPFSTQEMPDGGAAVTVGNVDRVYGMEWSTQLQLHPESTVLEEHVTLYNRSDVRHRFYWWNNAAMEVKDDTRIVYPMRWSAAHGFADVDTWPVDSTGTDLSVIANQRFGPVSRFVHGSREPFMGIWRPDTNTGTVHFANYAELPAKKIWSWGVDPDGLDWRRALSDNNSAYAEVQAGLFRNQETYAFLEPRQKIQFTEYWMPARGTGGITRANLAGVLHMERRGDGLLVAFNANHRLPGAHIVVTDGQQPSIDLRADIMPEHTWTQTVKAANSAVKYTFELRSAQGELLLRHREGEYDWSPAEEIQTGPQHPPGLARSAAADPGGWLDTGRNQELNGKLLAAFATYQSGLQKYPADLELMRAAGRLAAALLRYEDAVRYLVPVQKAATSDPEVAYYLALAEEGLGNTREARMLYESAARLPSFRAAGSLKLAELLARQGDTAGALRAFDHAGDDPRVVEEKNALRGEALPVSPDADRLLNSAAAYLRLGLYKPAIEILSAQYPAVAADQSEPGALLPQDHPLVAYYRGYCREQLHESGARDYAQASKLATQFVFPSRAETLPVLLAAIHANPQDATARYLLGTWYFARGLTDQALSEWHSARSAGARIPVLHADIGRALLLVKHDASGALNAFREGLPIDPANLALYDGIDESLSLLRAPASERVQALSAYPDRAKMPAALIYELALSSAEAGDYEGAVKLFYNRFFPRQEGGTNVRQVWVEVRTQEALAAAGSHRCDAASEIIGAIDQPVTGLDFTRDGLGPFVHSARTQYLLGRAEANCGRKAEAAVHFAEAAKVTGGADAVWAQKAAREMPGYREEQWRGRLEAVTSRAQTGDDDEGLSSPAAYSLGLAEAALGHKEAARARFEQALLLPDRNMAHHLSRLALE